MCFCPNNSIMRMRKEQHCSEQKQDELQMVIVWPHKTIDTWCDCIGSINNLDYNHKTTIQPAASDDHTPILIVGIIILQIMHKKKQPTRAAFLLVLFCFCYGFAMVLSSTCASFASFGNISLYDQSEDWRVALFRILALALPRVNIPSCSRTSPTALTCLVVRPNTSIACFTGKPSYCCRKSHRRETSGAFGCDVNFGTSSLIDCTYCHPMRIQSSPYNTSRNHMYNICAFFT